MYWQLDEDTRTPIICNNMSRNRFQEIKKYLHLVDNENIDKTDRMAKVRPLIETLCQKFQMWGYMHDELSIDEAMVRYFGHHSAKQFIRNKPTRFGFKNWMLTSSCGYLYNVDPYCGAKNVEPGRKHLPLGSRIVLELLEGVENPSNHIVYFDNFFTSHDLLCLLKKKGFRAMGTIRQNRTKQCPLKPKKLCKKVERGKFDYRYDTKNEVLMVQWIDNKVVTVGTNFDEIHPVCYVKRWCAKQNKKIDVPQPKLIANYNKSMGGVDLHDQAVNSYRCQIHSKKWWWPLFTTMLNSTMVNAWKLRRDANNSTMDLLQFHRSVTRHYLRNYTLAKSSKLTTLGSVSSAPGAHLPKRIGNPKRCRVCHQRIRWICELCDVALCVECDCFKMHHMQ